MVWGDGEHSADLLSSCTPTGGSPEPLKSCRNPTSSAPVNRTSPSNRVSEKGGHRRTLNPTQQLALSRRKQGRRDRHRGKTVKAHQECWKPGWAWVSDVQLPLVGDKLLLLKRPVCSSPSKLRQPSHQGVHVGAHWHPALGPALAKQQSLVQVLGPLALMGMKLLAPTWPALVVTAISEVDQWMEYLFLCLSST